MPRCACPTAAARSEPELRQALARELRRGKVDCTLQQRAAPSRRGAGWRSTQEALERLLARVRELAAAFRDAPRSI